ncbi:MAG: hypothetical protein ACRDAX_02595 [Propionibacteriaceae bacterium]
MRKDYSGRTQKDVEKLSLEEEFNLFKERYYQMQEILEDAQKAISNKLWHQGGGERIPAGGGFRGAHSDLPEATDLNSYYLDAARMIYLPNTGTETDLDIMATYFNKKGWTSHTKKSVKTTTSSQTPEPAGI